MDLENLSVPRRLRQQVSEGRLFHSYIVTGASAAGRRELARWLAAAAVCSGSAPPCFVCEHCRKVLRETHPDVITVTRGKDGKGLNVDAMRSVRSDACVMPNEAGRKVYVIEDADLMLPPAQNAMLKIFEEPPESTVFVLTAENPGRLLPTVLSRCVTVTAEDGGDTDPETEEAGRNLLAALCSDDSVEALEAVTGLEGQEREPLMAVLTRVKSFAADAVGDRRTSPGRRERLEKLIDTLETIERYSALNVGVPALTGVLLAGYVRARGTSSLRD